MSFLVINGVALPVSADSAKRPAAEEIGSRERMLDGSLFSHRRAKKRRLEFELVTTSEAAQLEAYEGLLRGDGHTWSFDSSIYSAKGLGPDAGYDAALAGGGWSGGKLTLTATTGTITYPAGLGSRWTVLVRRYEGSAWVHYAVRSDGAKWVNGARNDAAGTSWLSVSGGALTLVNAGALGQDYDDLVALPYLVHADWPALFSASAQPFSELPRLSVSGGALLGSSAAAPVTMMGEVGDATYTPARLGGVLDVTAQRLSASLREV